MVESGGAGGREEGESRHDVNKNLRIENGTNFFFSFPFFFGYVLYKNTDLLLNKDANIKWRHETLAKSFFFKYLKSKGRLRNHWNSSFISVNIKMFVYAHLIIAI